MNDEFLDIFLFGKFSSKQSWFLITKCINSIFKNKIQPFLTKFILLYVVLDILVFFFYHTILYSFPHVNCSSERKKNSRKAGSFYVLYLTREIRLVSLAKFTILYSTRISVIVSCCSISRIPLRWYRGSTTRILSYSSVRKGRKALAKESLSTSRVFPFFTPVSMLTSGLLELRK